MASNEKRLDQEYWNTQYNINATGWDLGGVSPPIKEYINTLKNKDISILIPGCGNSHEAEYLLSQGFTNVTIIDIAPTLVENLKEKFRKYPNIKIVLGDFFEHQGKYDLIIEQTFFCALPPTMREKYVVEMHKILKEKGLLVGLLFDRTFESSPPFGGSKKEYELLFKDYFDFKIMETCHNSIAPRVNTELFFELQKINK
jgi:SAM-dependent methyltransferase